jgi:hypothetical protein
MLLSWGESPAGRHHSIVEVRRPRRVSRTSRTPSPNSGPACPRSDAASGPKGPCAKFRRTKRRLTTRIENLPAALRTHARGAHCAEASVELLVGHHLWLARNEFVTGFVTSTRGPAGDMAWVEWEETSRALDAGRLACSPSEAQSLRLAASIAEGWARCGLAGG